MLFKRLLILLSIACIPYRVFATVFVVTTNADVGPGSFRNALMQAAANGSATRDFINFNLSDLTLQGRTIKVLSPLPEISSNLVIDGSTQPGTPYGVSTAKVCLLFDSSGQDVFSAITITNQSDITIYGLYFKLNNTFNPKLAKPVGLRLSAVNNFQLGDAQKGNVISGFYAPLVENYDIYAEVEDGSESSGLIFKSNLWSVESDGVTSHDYIGPEISNIYGTVQIGGTTAEGNIFAKGISVQPNNVKLCNINFSHNYSGLSYGLVETFDLASTQIGTPVTQTIGISNTTINIEDNFFASVGGNNTVPLSVSWLGGVVNIKRNYFNVNKQGKHLGDAYAGIYVQVCKEVHIGDDDPANANYIGYCWPIAAETTGGLTFRKNSIFCTTNNAVYFLDPPGFIRTQCNLTDQTSNSVSGTATPNAIVDLYYTDKCKTCSPQTYFTTVTADAVGNWAYNGALSGSVIANATYNNMSSEFTYTRIDASNIQITNACGGTGSITGIDVKGAIHIKWVDDKGNVVGNKPDVTGLRPGKYRLEVDNGGCSDLTEYYPILPKFALDASKATVKMPACGNSLGSITGLNLLIDDKAAIALTWKDANGVIVGNKLDLNNVPQGTYSFSAVSADTCIQTFGPVTLTDEPHPLQPPLVDNLILCSAGKTALNVIGPVAGNTYNLYDAAGSTTPIATSTNGSFQLDIQKDETYYVSQAFYDCESARTTVKVVVGLNESLIPNIFTPNGDGINDYWSIKGIERFPNALIQIFTRNGQKVFDSKGYTHPFDGTLNGSKLSEGVYYYIINLTTDCNIAGSLTIKR